MPPKRKRQSTSEIEQVSGLPKRLKREPKNKTEGKVLHDNYTSTFRTYLYNCLYTYVFRIILVAEIRIGTDYQAVIPDLMVLPSMFYHKRYHHR